MISRFALASVLLAAIAAGPIAAVAQQYPPAPPEVGGSQQPEAPPPGAPDQGVQPAPPVTGFHLRGIVAYSQPYFLMLDAGDSHIPVELHDGTVILPTGLTLAPGMHVVVDGYWVRHGYTAPMFVANRVAVIAQPPQAP